MRMESLIIALTPAMVYAGSWLSYYAFTERGDPDPVPEVQWGTPLHTMKHTIPGSVAVVLPKDHALDGMTAEYDILTDEDMNDDEISRR